MRELQLENTLKNLIDKMEYCVKLLKNQDCMKDSMVPDWINAHCAQARLVADYKKEETK